MPEAVCIDHTPYWWEVEQFQAHRHDYPNNDQAWPGSPTLPKFPESGDAKPTPKDVLDDTDYNVCRHVIRVVPTPQSEIRDVCSIESYTEGRPRSQDTSRLGSVLV